MNCRRPFWPIAHLSSPWSIGWVALSFLVRRLFVRRPALVTSHQISIFFNIYRHKSLALTQFHLIPSSTKLYWPSTTKYQPVLPSTDLVLSYINRFEFKRNYQVWPPTCAKHYCRCTSSPASPSSSSPLSSLFLASQRRPSSGSLSEYNQVFCHDHRFSGTRIRNFPTRWEICCRYFCLCSPIIWTVRVLWGE